MSSSSLIGGRFNFGENINSTLLPFHVLYIGSNNSTALSEKFQIDQHANDLSFQELALQTETSYSVVKLKGKVSNVFNLDRAKNTKPLIDIISKFKINSATTKLAEKAKIRPWRVVKTHKDLQHMCYAKDWAIHPNLFNIPSSSQIIGLMIRDAGFSGIIYSSTKSKGKCLAIFPDKLSDDSFVELATKPKGHAKARLDSKTMKSFYECCFHQLLVLLNLLS